MRHLYIITFVLPTNAFSRVIWGNFTYGKLNLFVMRSF